MVCKLNCFGALLINHFTWFWYPPSWNLNTRFGIMVVIPAFKTPASNFIWQCKFPDLSQVQTLAVAFHSRRRMQEQNGILIIKIPGRHSLPSMTEGKAVNTASNTPCYTGSETKLTVRGMKPLIFSWGLNFTLTLEKWRNSGFTRVKLCSVWDLCRSINWWRCWKDKFWGEWDHLTLILTLGLRWKKVQQNTAE